MAYISKMTSCKTILAALERTFKPQGSGWQQEAIEDIGWGIQGIGYHIGFEKKSTEPPYLTVAHHRAKIPCDVERIIHVEQLLPNYDQSGNVLNPDGTTPTEEETETCITTYRGVRMKLGSDTTSYGLTERSPRTTDISPAAPYYNLNGDYIVTEFESGLIKLHYNGFITDKNSYPMIVDDFDYKSALEWYCFQAMMLKGYKHPELSWKEAFAMWEMYRLRAENAPKVQSLDGAERFRATWCRFANGANFGNDFYMHQEHQEYISKQ